MRLRKPFDEAFRQWAERPPATPAAEAAAAVIAGRSRPRIRPWPSPAWATLAVAGLLIGSATTWLVRAPAPLPRHEAVASRLAAPSPDSDVVVVWLDDGTPVHLFLTDASARGVR